MIVKNFSSSTRFCIAMVIVLAVVPYQVNAQDSEAPQLLYIDTHAHIGPKDESVGAALTTMEEQGIRMTLIMPTPQDINAHHRVREAAALYPDRFAFLSGGGILNYLTQGKDIPGESSDDFESESIIIMQDGAIGFGEMIGEHFSLRSDHPYISVQPDHPLLLVLADIAARYDVPIDLHMEALTQDTPRDDLCDITSVCWTDPDKINPNPLIFPENITALETLLSHNRRARIVWVHAGWDNTGQRAVELMRRLLADHPNLYMSFKFHEIEINNPFDEDQLRPEWLDLVRSFPDRFTIGTDAKYDKKVKDLPLYRRLLDQLPPDLAQKVAYLNAVRIYNLNKRLICHRPSTRAAQTIWVDASSLNAHQAHGDTVGPCN